MLATQKAKEDTKKEELLKIKAVSDEKLIKAKTELFKENEKKKDAQRTLQY